jgi:hypothetical protein
MYSMTLSLSDARYGLAARNRLSDATDPSEAGARAALESFYYALNQRDLEALRGVWTTHPLAQLNNPLGGILRGGDAIAELYSRIFTGRVRLTVEFGDIAEYLGADHAVFAGRETGEYVVGSRVVPLAIRTTRYFRYDGERWVQFHHHGSIDDAEALAAYQADVLG